MFQRRAIAVSIALWLISMTLYYNVYSVLQTYELRYSYNIPMYRSTAIRRTGFTYNESDHFLISTPGCILPNFSKSLEFKEASRQHFKCTERLVFVEKTSDHEIMFRIERSKAKLGAKNKFQCCYSFSQRSTTPRFEDFKIDYSKCKPFENGHKTALEEEVITVSCNLQSNNKKVFTYEDAYFILKKKSTDELKLQTKDNVIVVKENWNVLLVGLDTMSRARAYNSLPKTVKYLKDHKWLDYRGYHKVGFNTFPNVMAKLTGLNASMAYHKCAGGMDKCKHLLIWNKFKEAGYVTAFGEDNLRLPDTFSPYKGFKFPPTDHYAKPFFLVGEYKTGNYICTRSKPSAQHLLEYAEQFAHAYKNDSFFGFFWINSCSHNLDYLPMLCENYIINFFESLEKNGALQNTFIFFLSDHGTRYGDMRKTRESYYEERLPMLFMWVPTEFREAYPEEYYNLQLNQHRLTTPYDIYMTMSKLMKMSNRDIDIAPSEQCPKCEGLVEEIPAQRTCEDAHINAKWCSCHNMNQVKNDPAANHSLNLAVTYVKNMSQSVKTIPCNICSPFKLKTVLRNDWYQLNNKTYYVVAFELSPGNIGYEATIEHYDNEFIILPKTETISEYNKRGNCVVNPYDRAYCVCKTTKDCKNQSKN